MLPPLGSFAQRSTGATTTGLRRRRGVLASVRSRATLAAVIVVGAALALGAVGLLGLLGESLRQGVSVSARAQLNDLVALVSLGELPNPLPVARGDNFAQVVGASGRILASSTGLSGIVPLVSRRPAAGVTLVTQIARLPGGDADSVSHGLDEDGPYLLLARTVKPVADGSGSPTAPRVAKPESRSPPGVADAGRADTGGLSGPATVYVAASLQSVAETSTTVSLALAAGLPVLTLLVGALVWLFCGRALRPVESIRAEVDDISARDLHRRVPEPSAMDEIGRLARTMNAMLQRLEDGAARQRRFVADASHELRSPLTTIQATLEVALAHPEHAGWQQVAADALHESRQLQHLVDDLLTLASAEEGALVDRVKLVPVDELVLEEVARLRQRTTELCFDVQGVTAADVAGDSAQLARAIRNLLDNARRHATKVISVEVSTEAGRVRIVVGDDGPGLAPDDRARVFERFTRLDEARSADEGGAGLGLAIVAEIVRLHQGTVQMVDAPVGARCVITLPAAHGDRSGIGLRRS